MSRAGSHDELIKIIRDERAVRQEGALVVFTLIASLAALTLADWRSAEDERSAPAAASAAPAPLPAPDPNPPPDALRHANGLASKVLAPGNGKVHPAINDVVTLSFKGWRADGSLFHRGDAIRMSVGDAIPALVDALTTMVAGERRRVWAPPALAYDKSAEMSPGPLVFDLELIAIAPGPKAPPFAYGATPDAKTTRDGLASKVLVAGVGRVHPRLDDGVRVRFTAWDTDGRLRYSSEDAVVLSPVSRDRPGWAAGVSQMVAGEKRVLWIPESLQQGLDPLGTGSPLAFVVDLVEVIPAPKAPPDVKLAPRDAIAESNGLSSKILLRGASETHPRSGDSVTVRYSSWSSDGKLRGSSYGGPITVRIADDAMAEALQLLVEGERRRVWVPREHVSRDGSRAAKGTVYDLELLKIDE